jgi:uncharacterized protein YggE
MARRILAFLLFATALPLGAANVYLGDSTVSVDGYALLMVLPDAAVLNFRIEVRDPELARIVNKANDFAKGIGAELRKAGIALPVVQNAMGDIYSEFNYEAQRMEYQYGLRMQVEIEDLGLLQKALKVLQDAPSTPEGLKIGYYEINYTLKDPYAYLSDLSQKAIEDAKKDAEKAASASGMKLGELISVGYGRPGLGYSWDPYMDLGASPQDMVGKDPSPRLLLRYEISATYKLVPGE